MWRLKRAGSYVTLINVLFSMNVHSIQEQSRFVQILLYEVNSLFKEMERYVMRICMVLQGFSV